MKKLLVLFSFLFLCHFISAQDYILKRNGEELYGNIKEISVSEIKYTDTLNTAVVRVLNKSEVVMIRFRNGMKEVFPEPAQTGSKTESPAVSSNKPVLEGPILELGSNDYEVNGRIYHFRQVKYMLLSVDDQQINRLLVLAKIEGIFGNVLAYSSIPVGYLGLLFLADDMSGGGNTSFTALGLVLITTCLASNGANIVLKINKKKKISEAIALYNQKVEAQFVQP